LRDGYPDLLEQYRRLIRDAFAERGGEEVDKQGDGFFFVFARAHDAALAAASAQRSLARHDWPGGVEVRVRIGMHTGETINSADGYHGVGIHRAARIMASAHGGQVLLSRATSSVLEDDELPGIALRDLGVHSLKDLDRPEQIHQLLIDDLPADFPPLNVKGTDVPLADHAAEQVVAAAKPSRSAHRRRVVIGVVSVAGVVTVALILTLALPGGGSTRKLSRVSGDSLGVVDAQSGKIGADIRGLAGAAGVTAGAGAIWVANSQGATVSRIDRDSMTVRQTITVGAGPSGITSSGGAVWVVNSLDGTVSRIDSETSQLVDTIAVGNGPIAIAGEGSSLWVTNGDDQTVSQISIRSGRLLKTIPTGVSGAGIAVEHGNAWLTDPTGSTISRLDLHSGEVTGTVNVGSGPTAIAAGGGSVWVANSTDGTVSRIDPRRGVVTATIPVGVAPGGIVVSGGAVWVSDEAGGTLTQIDSRTSRVVRKLKVGGRPQGLAVSAGKVWLAVQGGGGAHRGGTLALVGSAGPPSIDPGVAYDEGSWLVLPFLGDGLTGLKRVGGRDGNTLVADLAESLPRPTDGGRSYTFQLRRNIRYSNGMLVKPADVRWTFERLFKLRSSGIGFYLGIRGAALCLRSPAHCSLRRGIVADEAGRVTFHLTAPDSEFLYKLAVPLAIIVPDKSPAGTATRPTPGTGPYMVTSYRPGRELVLVRNPSFRQWSREAQPDGYPNRIVWKFEAVTAQSRDRQLNAVEAGRTDWLFDVPATRMEELRTRFPAQLHTTPRADTSFLLLNPKLPPFDRLSVRRAVNFAVDRAHVASLSDGIATPTCQILPPNFPAYKPSCRYTLNPQKGTWTAPDMQTARKLIAASGTAGMHIQVFEGVKPEGAYFVSLLNRLGYRATLRYIPFTRYYQVIAASPDTIQAAGSQWVADYPQASNFFAIFKCGAGNLFCDPAVDREAARASQLQFTNMRSANALWARLYRKLIDRAVAVPLTNISEVDFLARRVGNYQCHPFFGVLLDQLWVR
jgi:YVTN family beta-propeller protein